MSSEKRNCVSQPGPLPSDMRIIFVCDERKRARLCGTTSSSAAYAPALSSSFMRRWSSFASSTVRPIARQPVHVTCRGTRPRWPTTGMPSRAIASTMNGLAEQYTELAPISSARKATRIASSCDASPWGVAHERKLFGAAATSAGRRACASGESKLQLIKSTLASSAAAASSGDFTWMCVRHRLPLSF